MLRAGLGVSTALDPGAAAEEAVGLAVARLDGETPSVSLVLGSAAHGQALPELAKHVAKQLDGSPFAGGSVEGVVAPGVEVSSYPALLVLTLAGIDAVPFLMRDVDGVEERVGEDLSLRLSQGPNPEDVVVVIPDSLGLNAARLVAGLAEHLAPATVLGTGAAPAARGAVCLWSDAGVAHDGVAGIVLRRVQPRLGIAQAGRAITPLLGVTRARGNWVLGLDGRPALDVYREAASGQGPEPPGRWDEASAPLLVGIARASSAEPIVRNVVGFDASRGAFSVPEPMRSGDRLALFELDGGWASDAFAAQLAPLRDPAPAFGLYVNCRARGAALFGEAGVEATHLANAFADCPVAGAVGPFQIAPPEPGARPVVLTYAGALALLN
jgi:small ligand-binding sensory domain FIST